MRCGEQKWNHLLDTALFALFTAEITIYNAKKNYILVTDKSTAVFCEKEDASLAFL